MITVSVCMIVKNEESTLGKCLDCLKEFADEIIIVDTGSTDKTKEVAKEYTEKIFDFEWEEDFSKARNFSFGKASMEYIYVADADEVIDEENQEKMMNLKKVLLEEIEIVQMKYTNQLEYGTTYNYDTEYRGKLFKKIRKFKWIDPIHERVNVEPIVYDSDIEIIHKPNESHAKRDFELFQKTIRKGETLSSKLMVFYAKELYIAGDDTDFLDAKEFFSKIVSDENTNVEDFRVAACIAAKAARISNDVKEFFSCCLKLVIDNPCSEICYEIGEYYFAAENYKEASIWFYNAACQCSPSYNIHYGGDYPLIRLAECYKQLGNPEQAKEYDRLAYEWQL